MQIQEAIRQGNLELRKLEEDQVRLKQESILMDADIRKLETNITQALHVNRRTGQHMGSPTTALGDYRQEFLAMLPWLQPRLIRQSNQGSAPHKEEREALTDARVTKEGP